MQKFETHAAASAAARARNIEIVGGGEGGGFIIDTVKGFYDGWTWVPGYFVANAKYPGSEHRVRPI